MFSPIWDRVANPVVIWNSTSHISWQLKDIHLVSLRSSWNTWGVSLLLQDPLDFLSTYRTFSNFKNIIMKIHHLTAISVGLSIFATYGTSSHTCTYMRWLTHNSDINTGNRDQPVISLFYNCFEVVTKENWLTAVLTGQEIAQVFYYHICIIISLWEGHK